MERWSNKVAVVTGASAGIGAATVEALAKSGLIVVAVARRLDRLESHKNALKGVKGQIHPFKADISKVEDVEKLFSWVKSKFNKIHVLINNAGIVRQGSIEDGKLQDFIDIINTNFIGLVACSQATLKLMKEAGIDDGHIININSVAGHCVPNVNIPLNVYPSSKYGVTALTETLRQELVMKKSKIRVTSISPGYVKTEIVEAMLKTADSKMKQTVMESVEQFTQVGLESEDIANSILYVLSTPPHVQVHEIIIKPVGETM